MRCEQVLEQLCEDGGLGWIQRWRLQRHLASCPACTREWAALRRTVEILEAVPDRPAPDGLWQAIEQGMALERSRRRESTSSPPHGWKRRWVPVAAAAAAFILIGFGWFRPYRALAPAGEGLEDPAPFLRYHHLLAQQEVLAEASSLEVLAMTGNPRDQTWERDG